MTPEFQSTLPVWAATAAGNMRHYAHKYFNPRCPCGQRQRGAKPRLITERFQSTLPVWAATTEI